MNKIYYFLLGLLVLVSIGLVGILVVRADQSDKFFKYQELQKERTYEPN